MDDRYRNGYFNGEVRVMKWTREHDRIIAERCLGKKVVTHLYTNELGWEEYIEDCGMVFVRLPYYANDIRQVLEAAQSWKSQNYDNRVWQIQSMDYEQRHEDGEFCAYLSVFDSTGHWYVEAFGESPSNALALSLYDVVRDDK